MYPPTKLWCSYRDIGGLVFPLVGHEALKIFFPPLGPNNSSGIAFGVVLVIRRGFAPILATGATMVTIASATGQPPGIVPGRIPPQQWLTGAPSQGHPIVRDRRRRQRQWGVVHSGGAAVFVQKPIPTAVLVVLIVVTVVVVAIVDGRFANDIRVADVA